MKECQTGDHLVEKLWIAKGRDKLSACKDCYMKTQSHKVGDVFKPIDPKGLGMVEIVSIKSSLIERSIKMSETYLKIQGMMQPEEFNKLNTASEKPFKAKPIAKFSEKKIMALKIYRKLRDQYFKDHPVCEFPLCKSTDITLHHAKGRIGELLTDITYFRSLCLKHHSYIEAHPSVAKSFGLSFNRLDK